MKRILILVAVSSLIFGIACSKTVVKESDVDTPKERYLSGMQKLDNNDLKKSEEDFLRAIELDKKSPFGYTGMAFLELQRTNYNTALKYVKKALKYDKNFSDAYAARGYILTVIKDGDKWFNEAVEPLKKALTLDPENERAMFFLAECLLKAKKYEEAQNLYVKVAEKQDSFAVKAGERKTLMGKLMKASPVSVRGGYIALDDKIDRSDLCILLIDELQLKELLKKFRPMAFAELYNENLTLKKRGGKNPPDVNGHRAKDWIVDIIPLHLAGINVFPNGYYYPDRLLTRAQIATVMQEIIVKIKDDPSLSTMYIGSESRFPDVRGDYYAFNAITLCVEKGIMETDSKTGVFDAESTVSGVEAVTMIRALERYLGEQEL